MSYVIAAPEVMAAAASDVANIGSTISAANTAAAAPTTGMLVAGADEVSAAIASLFSDYAQQYQALSARAAAFHAEFAQVLAAAGSAYTAAEAHAASTLGAATAPVQALLAPLIGATPSPVYTQATMGSDPAVTAILIMTGSLPSVGVPATSSTTFMNEVYSRYLSGTFGGPMFTGPLQFVSTAGGFYPFTGVKDLTLDQSLARGVIELDNAIVAVLGPAPSAGSVSVLGYSQSAITASMEMPKLLAEGYHGGVASNAYFTLVGDPSNPNGGLDSRFPGLSLPSLGVRFGTATPSNDFPTTIWTREYDGFADFPQYPIDFLADLNAFAGIVYVHATYPTLTAAQLSSAVTLPQSGAPSQTAYYMIPTQNLPLLEPLRSIPGLGNPLADLVQPDLRYLINWGYGDPNYGWSAGPADVPTPFGFLPPPSATTSLPPLLVRGAQQGFGAFASDLSAEVPKSLAAMSLPGIANSLMANSSAPGPLALPTATSMQSTIAGVLAGLESANNNIVGSLTYVFSSTYATLLPTADIATAVAISLPSYDFDLFINGIIQAVNGDPAGLINAIGDPIAADVGLITLAGGFALIPFVNLANTILFVSGTAPV